MAIDESTFSNYTSTVNSYVSFCRNHNFPTKPTPNTLSFYTVCMSHHIKPLSVDSYLSGICNQLEVYFPNVHKARKSQLVTCTFWGCKCLKGSPISRKSALTISIRNNICSSLSPSSSHNGILFVTLVCTGFYSLMCLSELVWPDSASLQNWNKVSRQNCVTFLDNKSYSFFLPSHKADQFFEGNCIFIHYLIPSGPDPLPTFLRYLKSRDQLFPLSPELWLCADGKTPTHHFFIQHLHQFCNESYAGQSLCAGRATALTEAGVAPVIIQGIRCWSTETFQIYIRKSPVLIQAFIFASPAPAKL
jgi:hypothetical protein